MQMEFLGHRVGFGVSDQILADLGVDVVPDDFVLLVERVEAHGHTVGQLVGEVGMHQHSHRGCGVVDAMELAFGEGAEVPEAGVDLLEGL